MTVARDLLGKVLVHRTVEGVTAGAIVELWGIRHAGRNELRAWRVASSDAAGQPIGVLVAPRLLPLLVALFLPAFLLLIAWLLTLVL